MRNNSHLYSFPGGRDFTSLGASWFASYLYYTNNHPQELSWTNCAKSSLEIRINIFNKTAPFHGCWAREVLKMCEARLSTNKLGLSGTQVKKMIEQVL